MLCDCNGLRIPTKWKVTIAGTTNGVGCSACASLDGDYYPERVGTNCTLYEVSAGGTCNLTLVRTP